MSSKGGQERQAGLVTEGEVLGARVTRRPDARESRLTHKMAQCESARTEVARARTAVIGRARLDRMLKEGGGRKREWWERAVARTVEGWGEAKSTRPDDLSTCDRAAHRFYSGPPHSAGLQLSLSSPLISRQCSQ